MPKLHYTLKCCAKVKQCYHRCVTDKDFHTSNSCALTISFFCSAPAAAAAVVTAECWWGFGLRVPKSQFLCLNWLRRVKKWLPQWHFKLNYSPCCSSKGVRRERTSSRWMRGNSCYCCCCCWFCCYYYTLMHCSGGYLLSLTFMVWNVEVSFITQELIDRWGIYI